MKRFKNLVIGGIQSKVFNLILYTVVLLTAAYMALSIYHSNMLTQIVEESSQRQEAAMTGITSSAMDQVVTQSLVRTNQTDAQIADAMFQAVRDQATFLGDMATGLFAHPERYTPQPYAGPNPADDGKWTAKVIYAEGVDEADPVIVSKVGLLANLSETMVSLCPSLGAANAGQEYPVLKRPDGNYELYKDRHGFVIGGMEGVAYREYEIQMEPGSKLFVYTDGVPEATNAEKQLFGTERMVDALNAQRDAAPQDALKNVRGAVDAFVKDAEQFDDLTMLCLEYKGAASKGGAQG